MLGTKTLDQHPTQAILRAGVVGFFMICAAVGLMFPFYRLYTASLTPNANAWDIVQHVGIIIPVLSISVGVLFLRLIRRLLQRDIGAARWARSVLTWGLVINGILAASMFNSGFSATPLGGNPVASGVASALPLLGIMALIAGVYVVHRRTLSAYYGDEHAGQQNTRKAWNLLAPALIIFLLIALSPLESVFMTSLTNARFAGADTPEFVGLNNYAELLGFRLDTLPCETDDSGACLTDTDRNGITETVYVSPRDYLDPSYTEFRYRVVREFDLFGTHFIVSARDREFFDAAWNSVVYTVFAIALQVTLGLFIAMILSTQMRGGGILRLALLIPLAIPTLIATQFWAVILESGSSGIANNVLLSLGMIERPQAWLLDRQWQIPSVILVIVWKETPTMALLLLPGLLGIPKEVYQAANVDGANRIQRFFLITLPLMRPIIGVAVLLRAMVTLRVFDVFDILLGNDPNSMATYAYELLVVQSRQGYSSAVSVTIFGIVLIFTIFYFRTLNLDEV